MRPSPRRLLLKGLLRLNTSTSVYIASHISSHRSQFYTAAAVVVVGLMKYWQHVRNMVVRGGGRVLGAFPLPLPIHPR